MQKHNDGKLRLRCPNCGKFHYYDLDDDENCEKISSNVYQIWCKSCQTEFPYLSK
jgi:hypothetical protein